MNDSNNENSRVEFNAGDAESTVYIDNVSLKDIAVKVVW